VTLRRSLCVLFRSRVSTAWPPTPTP